MRKMFKTLVAICGVCMLSSATASAQKFGYVDSQEILMQLPDVDSVQTKLDAYIADLRSRSEIMQVEYNKKLDDYQKTSATSSDAIKRDKEKELQALGQRIQEFNEQSQTNVQTKQQELIKPLADKIDAAIAKVSKAQGLAAVFNVNVLEYFDKNLLVDVNPLVKAELKIK